VEVGEGVAGYLAAQGFDETFGARPLRRAIVRLVEDRLSEEMLRGTFERGDRVLLRLEGDRLVVEKAA